MKKRYTIAVDFDGVLHSYLTPWIDAETIPDPPIAGAIEWLTRIRDEFDVVIFTTRGKTARARDAIRKWLWENGYSEPDAECWGDLKIAITNEKSAALIYLDDRAVRFEGSFPTADAIYRAKPWKQQVPA